MTELWLLEEDSRKALPEGKSALDLDSVSRPRLKSYVEAVLKIFESGGAHYLFTCAYT